ncbi:MAG: LysM peptidoglycan-binding domain-containing protein, partial [Bacteroidaceae bacterium]|nr:LysM peptidoglycan-binding domain-containing protein [Bacteroidaceae bacterium]
MKRIILLFCWLPALLWGQSSVLSSLDNMHKVQKGETVYSISRMYGVSVEALERANDIKDHKIKKGTLLNIPTPPPPPTPTPVVESNPIKTRYDHLRVGVLLPLEEQSERAGKFVEFYQGLLMAADSVRGEGTRLDIYAWHSGSTLSDIKTLMEKIEAQPLDIIFG